MRVCTRPARCILPLQTRYCDLARDLVTTVRKTESSLKRLKDRRAGAAAGGAGAPAASAAAGGGSDMSDTDKICRQLALDAAEYGRQLRRFGVDAAALPPFTQLWHTVAGEGEPIAF